MAVLTPPAGMFDFAAATLSRRVVAGVTRSPFSFASERYLWNGETWEISVSWPNATEAEARALDAFLTRLSGGFDAVIFAPPETAPLGVINGDPALNGAHSAGATVLSLDHVDGTSAAVVGDFLSIGSRLHSVVEVSAPAAGVQSVTVWPALRADAADAAEVNMLAPVGTWRLLPGPVGHALGEGATRSQGLLFIEDL